MPTVDTRQNQPAWLFIPGGAEYVVPWLVGLALLPIVAALGTPLGSVPQIAIAPGRTAALAALCLLFLVADGALLWASIRAQFAVWATGWRAVVGTTLGLGLVYWAVATITLSLRGVIRFAPRLGEAQLGPTLYAIAHGLTGLTAVLLFSAIWKFEEPGYANVRQARRTALVLLGLLDEGKLRDDDFRALRGALDTITKEAQMAIARTTRAPDRRVLDHWRRAAAVFMNRYADLALKDLDMGTADSADRKTVNGVIETLRRTD